MASTEPTDSEPSTEPDTPAEATKSTRTAASTPMSTGDYLRLVVREPLVVAGLAVFVLGVLLVVLSDPAAGTTSARLGGGALLVGTVVLGVGYTRVQHRLRDLSGAADETGENETA